MIQYTTVVLSIYIYSVVIIHALAIRVYLLLIPCGTETDIEGENNIVRNAQKIDILSPNMAMNGDSSCKIWESYGFELFEFLVLSFLTMALMYWRLHKVFRKEGLLDTIRKRKEETKTKKLQVWANRG